MDQLGELLQAVGYHFVIVKPLLPMYLHLIASALFPIFTGAHASLSRPSSTAKPPKKIKKSDDDEESDDSETEQKMEGLSSVDALLFPITGGITLVGLYYLIKYLDDPALLNKILNWYFAIFGTFALARLLADTASTIWSFLFPKFYQQHGKTWKVDSKARKVWASDITKESPLRRGSPLPHYLASLPLPFSWIDTLWNVKAFSSQKLRINAYVHNFLNAKFNLSLFDVISVFIAVPFELYFNLVAKPWWLTNLLGFSLSYVALQIMSPTTAWTGTLLLNGLFFYDIYFVFFTPVMVKVATTIDIPAKLLFPRPETNSLSMLGLGDVVLPGIIIGFALRFDLFLYYLRKQVTSQSSAAQWSDAQSSDAQTSDAESSDVQNSDAHSSTWSVNATEATSIKDDEDQITKAKYFTATGGWGERFWTPKAYRDQQGGRFPKTYFYSTMIGYIIGMILTLGVMQVYGHAQPALLYLVPGVLCALWGTALVRGEVKMLWNFRDTVEEDDLHKEDRNEDTNDSEVAKSSWQDWFLIGRISKRSEEKLKTLKDATEAQGKKTKAQESEDEGEKEEKDQVKSKVAKSEKWNRQLVSFSVSLAQSSA